MITIQELKKLDGITNQEEMIKACSQIADEDLRSAVVLLALLHNKIDMANDEIMRKQNEEIETLKKENAELRERLQGK